MKIKTVGALFLVILLTALTGCSGGASAAAQSAPAPNSVSTKESRPAIADNTQQPESPVIEAPMDGASLSAPESDLLSYPPVAVANAHDFDSRRLEELLTPYDIKCLSEINHAGNEMISFELADGSIITKVTSTKAQSDLYGTVQLVRIELLTGTATESFAFVSPWDFDRYDMLYGLESGLAYRLVEVETIMTMGSNVQDGRAVSDGLFNDPTAKRDRS